MRTKAVLIIVAVAVIATAVVTYILATRGGPDPAYWVKRADYDAKVKEHEAWLLDAQKYMEARDEEINQANEKIAESEIVIAELERRGKQEAADGQTLAAENRRLKADAAAAIQANPAVRALVDNYDLRCANYESQVFTLKQTIGEKDSVIDAQGQKIVALQFQKNEAVRMFEQERSLRQVSDMLRKDLESKYKSTKFWRGTAIVSNLVWAAIAIF